MTGARATATLAALFFLAGGCAREERPTMVIFASPAGELAPLHQLRATFGHEGKMDSRFFPTSRQASPLVLPASFSVSVPSSKYGLLDVTLEGLDEAGSPVAGGATQVTIVPGRIVESTVWLVSWLPPPPDAGDGDSGTEPETDGSSPESDAAVPPDDAGPEEDAGRGEDDATVP